jgi:hypothetical protein
MDWVRPTDEVLAKMAMVAAERSDVPAPHLQHPTLESSTPSRWRKFAARFKRSARKLIPLLSMRSGGVGCDFSSAKITRRLHSLPEKLRS